MARKFLSSIYVFCIFTCLMGPAFCQTSQNAVTICTGLYKLNMYDTDNILSAQQYFQQVQNILKDSALNQYSDLQSMENNFGGSFSDIEDAIGLTDDAKKNSSIFTSQMHNFLSSSFENSERKSYFEEHRSTINQGIIGVINTCISQYFKDINVALGVEVTPGYSNFSVVLIAKIPSNPPENLKIIGMTPASLVKCTLNGKPVPLNQNLGNTKVLLECNKKPTLAVDNLIFNTNADISPAISLPAQGPNSPNPRPSPPPIAPEPIHAVWQTSIPAAGTPFGGHCTCAAISYSSKLATLTNRCGDQIEAIAVKRTNWYVPPYPLQGPFAWFPGTSVFSPFAIIPMPQASEKYASVNIPNGREATFDISDGTGGYITFSACPTQHAPAVYSVAAGYYLLPAVSDAPACFIEKNNGGAANSFVCDAVGLTPGTACTCNVPGWGSVPTKSYPGRVTRLNCQDGLNYKPCDF
jgi:hypothetical protein